MVGMEMNEKDNDNTNITFSHSYVILKATF